MVALNRDLAGRYDFEVCGVPVHQLRQRIRHRVAETADRAVIVTGHQPDFFHAGVWAKQVIAARLAEAVNGVAVNLVVDNDAPAQTAIDVPSVHHEGVRIEAINYAHWPAGAAFEDIPAADTDAAVTLAGMVRHALGDERFAASVLPDFFDTYSVAASRWVDQVVAARRAVDDKLGIHVVDRAVSTVWCGPLMGELILNARRFAVAYNEALAEYRTRFDVRQPTRPLPDLGIDDERCELAMWAYRPGQARRRMFVSDTLRALELFAGDERIARLNVDRISDWKALCCELEQTSPWRVRPRALTLTLWARLFLADLFIHGIGGAKYDRITDDIIRRYFRVEPPAMACVSATLRLNLPTHQVGAEDIRIARRKIRDFEFNPHYFVSDADAGDDLGARARALAESDRLRTEDPDNRAARRQVFHEIREINERIAAHRPQLHEELDDDLHRLLRWNEENANARRRDFFFALHPRAELNRLLDNLPKVHDFRG